LCDYILPKKCDSWQISTKCSLWQFLKSFCDWFVGYLIFYLASKKTRAPCSLDTIARASNFTPGRRTFR
jgi:hypothetical protein